jgi:hypothetical protein
MLTLAFSTLRRTALGISFLALATAPVIAGDLFHHNRGQLIAVPMTTAVAPVQQAVPVQMSYVQAAPVQMSFVQAAPVQMSFVQAAPVQAAPAMSYTFTLSQPAAAPVQAPAAAPQAPAAAPQAPAAAPQAPAAATPAASFTPAATFTTAAATTSVVPQGAIPMQLYLVPKHYSFLHKQKVLVIR